MKETIEILKQMGFVNPNDNVWTSELFGVFILLDTATPEDLALFIYDRGYRKGMCNNPNTNQLPLYGTVVLDENNIHQSYSASGWYDNYFNN